MLSYRHGFHAGSFADVHKHIILVAILSYLQKKAKPFSYIDSHAGAGLYPIDLPYMQKTKEYANGIAKLFKQTPKNTLVQEYLSVIKQFNPTKELTIYPGSPLIAANFLNQEDKMHALELHSTDYPLLKQALKIEKRAKVHNLNAYESLLAFLPPPAKRGLVMIDPSYEVKNEFQQVVELVKHAHKRFNTGIYAIWYPIVDRDISQKFVRAFKNAKIPNILNSEICISADTPDYGMTGSGVLIINPPFTLHRDLQKSNQCLHEVLNLYSESVTKIA